MTNDLVEPSDAYWTVAGETRAEITIKKSVFIGCLFHVSSKAEALDDVAAVRTEHYDAAHHCYAYRLGHHGQDFRAVDDGEPSGTAGKPILFCLQKARLSDVLCVVVRHFGGVKLGTGGLARAYAEAAQAAIDLCERRIVQRMRKVNVFCTYDDVSRITALLEEVGAIFRPTYSDAIFFDADIPLSRVDDFLREVTERTNARAGYSFPPDVE